MGTENAAAVATEKLATAFENLGTAVERVTSKDGGSLFESCGHAPCKTQVNKKTGAQFGSKWYHKECLDGIHIRSIRQTLPGILPRALAMGMVRKLNRP